MVTETRQQGNYPMRGQGGMCEPDEPDPAPQPKDPGGQCATLPVTTPPVLADPEKCPEPPCDCPQPPTGTTSNCLEELIADQAKEVNGADRAKAFKAELEALQQKAKTAAAEYTLEKYKKLVAEWERQDADIAELIRKLVCAVPCWWCLIECYICPLLYEIGYREQQLYGEETLYGEVHSLHDLRYWHDRNRDARKRALERIKAVLGAWEKPAQTIEKTLAADATLIAEAGKLLAPDAVKLVYDVFLRLVPTHLAIAPPAGSGKTTRIAKKYTQLCECDQGDPDDCCGPDVGRLSLRQRLVGPLPYLINPNDFFATICCLTRERYLPAKDAWSAAESAFEGVDMQIKRTTAEIEEKMKSLEKDAKAGLPLDCSDWVSSSRSEAR